jgi:hypothetical protein
MDWAVDWLPKLQVSSRGRVNFETIRSKPRKNVTEHTKSSKTSRVKRVIEEHLLAIYATKLTEQQQEAKRCSVASAQIQLTLYCACAR